MASCMLLNSPALYVNMLEPSNGNVHDIKSDFFMLKSFRVEYLLYIHLVLCHLLCYWIIVYFVLLMLRQLMVVGCLFLITG